MIPKKSVLSKMSCLVVARKAWKSFTTKLRRKLRKIQFDPHHIIIKKPRKKHSPKLPPHYSISFTLKKSSLKKSSLKKSSHNHHSRGRTKHHKLFTRVLGQRKYYPFKKQPQYYTPPPIFIDDLFRFRAAEKLAAANSLETAQRRKEAATDDPSTSSSSSKAHNKARYPATKDGLRIMSDQGTQYAEPETVLDHRIYPTQMSPDETQTPLMIPGIDARAEEFITRFRAELYFQETGAHYL